MDKNLSVMRPAIVCFIAATVSLAASLVIYIMGGKHIEPLSGYYAGLFPILVYAVVSYAGIICYIRNVTRSYRTVQAMWVYAMVLFFLCVLSIILSLGIYLMGYTSNSPLTGLASIPYAIAMIILFGYASDW